MLASTVTPLLHFLYVATVTHKLLPPCAAVTPLQCVKARLPSYSCSSFRERSRAWRQSFCAVRRRSKKPMKECAGQTLPSLDTHTHACTHSQVKGQDDLTKYGRSDITLYYSDITPECSQSDVDAAAPSGTVAAVGLQSSV